MNNITIRITKQQKKFLEKKENVSLYMRSLLDDAMGVIDVSERVALLEARILRLEKFHRQRMKLQNKS